MNQAPPASRSLRSSSPAEGPHHASCGTSFTMDSISPLRASQRLPVWRSRGGESSRSGLLPSDAQRSPSLQPPASTHYGIESVEQLERAGAFKGAQGFGGSQVLNWSIRGAQPLEAIRALICAPAGRRLGLLAHYASNVQERVLPRRPCYLVRAFIASKVGGNSAELWYPCQCRRHPWVGLGACAADQRRRSAAELHEFDQEGLRHGPTTHARLWCQWDAAVPGICSCLLLQPSLKTDTKEKPTKAPKFGSGIGIGSGSGLLEDCFWCSRSHPRLVPIPAHRDAPAQFR